MTKTVNNATNRLFAGESVSVLPGTEPKEQTAEERWNSAGIGNAFIFGKVMSANPDLLLELLQISLPEMEIVEILDPRQEERRSILRVRTTQEASAWILQSAM